MHAILLSNRLDVVPAKRATVIRQLAAQLARDLDEASQQPADRLVTLRQGGQLAGQTQPIAYEEYQ